MIIEELCKQYNVDTTTIPKGILEIKIGDNELSEYSSGKKEKNKITFKGKTGKANIEIVITLTGIDNDEVEILKSYINEDKKFNEEDKEVLSKLGEYLFKPVVNIKTVMEDKRIFQISYNVFGGEINKS